MEAGPRVGFLGAGRMASALARLDRRRPDDRRARPGRRPLAAAREAFSGGGPLRAVGDNREVVSHADLLVLAVKPQSMKALMEEIRPHTDGSAPDRVDRGRRVACGSWPKGLGRGGGWSA